MKHERFQSPAERANMLREEFADLLAGWHAKKSNFGGGWVPVRLLPITGIIAHELARARMVDFDGERIRPRKHRATSAETRAKDTFGAASACRTVDVETYLREKGGRP
jgi:hypothetical protein